MPENMRKPKPNEKAIDFTNLNRFLTCPSLYYFYKMGGRDYDDCTHRLRGAVVHEIFGRVIDKNISEKDAHTLVVPYSNKLSMEFPGCPWDREKVYNIVHDQISTSYLTFKRNVDALSTYEKFVEKYMCMTVRGWEIFGYADYVFVDKFTKSMIFMDGKGSLKQDITPTFRDQLAFYKMLLKHEFGFDVQNAGIFFFQTGELKYVDTYTYFISDLTTQLGLLEVSKFQPSPGKVDECYTCPKKKSCLTYNKRKRKEKYYLPHDPVNNILYL